MSTNFPFAGNHAFRRVRVSEEPVSHNFFHLIDGGYESHPACWDPRE
jgi:hypothetical protein